MPQTGLKQESENEQVPQEKYLMSKGAAWIIRDILSNVQYREPLSQMVSHGTSLAWKTGTSYGFRDAWAIGMTADYTIGIWTGRPDGTPVPGHYGAQTAAPLLRAVTLNLPPVLNSESSRIKSLNRPESVSRKMICWPGGGLQSNTDSELCQKTQLAWILDNTVPPVLSKDPNVDTVLNEIKIVSIDDGDHIKAPQGSNNAISINLEARGGQGDILWFINGKSINQQATNVVLSYTFQQSGQYKISAIDQNGHSDHVTLYVQSTM